jgi:hypothetical protein
LGSFTAPEAVEIPESSRRWYGAERLRQQGRCRFAARWNGVEVAPTGRQFAASRYTTYLA